MKQVSLTILLFIYDAFVFGQPEKKQMYSIDQIQGIWQLYANYSYPTDESIYKIFHIFKENKFLSVDISENPYDKLSVTVSSFGFSNSFWRDSICAMKHLNDTGSYFIQLSENANLKDCNINVVTTFSLKEQLHLNLFGDECNYLEKAPKEVLEVLFKRGKHDKRDYIKEFLELRVCGIQAEKSYIYYSTFSKTRMYLIKNDILTIKDEKDGFVKMEYETAKNEIIKGWVKKEDLDCIE